MNPATERLALEPRGNGASGSIDPDRG